MNNTKLDFYQIFGVIAPGTVFLLGLLFLFPSIKIIFINDGLSIGGFGLFLLISYIMGNLIQSVGNLLEKIWWQFFGGMPTNWIIKNKLLTNTQKKLLMKHISEKIDINQLPKSLENFNEDEWKYIVGQIRTIINSSSSKSERLFIFNSTYGLNRGIASAFITILVLLIIVNKAKIQIVIILILLIVMALYRMHRFAKHYAKELVNQFINIKL